MILEPLEPLRIRLDGQVRELVAGRPFELPEAQARKLLELVPGKVRSISEASVNWLRLWRDVAEVSSGLESADLRFESVMTLIQRLDEAFEEGNVRTFTVWLEELQRVMSNRGGALQ